MNQQHVVQSASKALLRASNALDDLQTYLHQLKGSDLSKGLLATSGKVSQARELVREIDVALADPDLSVARANRSDGRYNLDTGYPSTDSQLAGEQSS